jgi:NADH:ubiquinone oxidoreductase subunit 4 (subunit M)
MIGALYMLRAVRTILHGPLPEQWSAIPDASNVWRKLPYALLLASLFVFGVWPRLLTEKITPDAQKIVAMVNASAAVSAAVVGVAPTTLLAGATPANTRETRALPEIHNPQSSTRN